MNIPNNRGSVEYRRHLQAAYDREDGFVPNELGAIYSPMTTVIIGHEDGTVIQHSAFIEIHEDWLYLFAEHAAPLIFHTSEIIYYGAFERRYFQ